MNNINLIEEIIDKIPEGLTDLEKLYYIYIETCKIFDYDTRYNDSPYIIGEVIKHNYQNIKNIKETTIVCSVWSRMFMNLIKKVGIKAKYVSRGGHTWVESYARVKHNDSIHHFYPVTDQETDRLPIMDTNAIFDIDKLNKKVGYVVSEDEFFDFLEKKIVNLPTLKEKIDVILENAQILGDNVFDDWQYIKNLLRVLLHEEHSQIIFGSLAKINDDYTFSEKELLIVEDNNNQYYYLFDKEINLVSTEELIANADSGYGIKTLYKNVKLDYPLKFKTPKASLHYFLSILGFKNKTHEKCYNKTR